MKKIRKEQSSFVSLRNTLYFKKRFILLLSIFLLVLPLVFAQTQESDIQLINRKIQLLAADVESLKATLNQNTNTLNSISTGLASLQTNISDTQTQITEVEGSRFFTKLFFFLVFFAVLGGVLFYLLHYRRKPTPHHKLKRHIYHHLKKGRPYHSIRKELLNVGWLEEHISSAYKSVLSHNYRKYSEAKKPELRPKLEFKKPRETNKRKVAIIAGVSILLLIGIYLLLSGVIGKAIQTQRIFAHQEPFICTPPHIVTEGGCCLDINANGICDVDEEYEKGRTTTSAPVCHDHRDCISGEVCVDNHCGILSEQYRTECPGQEKCNINRIKISTSDGETYTLHAKKGSYTAAGALAWTIRPVPNYCYGELVKVPVEIEKTDLICYDDLGQIVSCDQGTNIACTTNEDCAACPNFYGLPCYCHNTDSRGTCVKDIIDKIDVQISSKEIITLALEQTSERITHPNPKINERLGGFTLTLQDVNEFCFPGSAG